MTGDWRDRAACVGSDPELFFPTATTGPAYDTQVAAAKAVCGRCPVRVACLTEALVRIPYGVAGGLTEDERRELRAARRHAAVSGRGDPVTDPDPVELARYGRGAGASRAEVATAAVALVESGRPVREVAQWTGASDRTVARWVARARTVGDGAR